MFKWISFILFFQPMALNAKGLQDYTVYHKNIIAAEKAVFMENDPVKGLGIFKNTFSEYDFVFVDDCIEAFQLALVFKREKDALFFIKRALDNGFELQLLNDLSPGCICNLQRFRDTVSVIQPFVLQHLKELEIYSAYVYPQYLKRIDRNLLAAIIKRHVEEQFFKDNWRDNKYFYKVNESNFNFIDSLAGKGIFLGERNLGVYTDKLAASLNLPFKSINNYVSELLKSYKYPPDTKVPISTRRGDYYGPSPLYIILYHYTYAYNALLPYMDQAIRQGYWHPREIASLKVYGKKYVPKLYNKGIFRLIPTALVCQPNVPVIELDKEREAQYLPSYELDSLKHVFAHKYGLKLFFGFMQATR